MIHHNWKGFTLIELVWVLAVVAVVANISLGFAGLIKREQRYLAQLELRRLVGYARAEAVSRGEPVTLCALAGDGSCTREWTGRTIAVFADRDGNGRATETELLRLANWEESRGALQWRASLGRARLEFSAFGNTHQNGSFHWCYKGKGQPADLVLSINRGGRPYLREVERRRCL